MKRRILSLTLAFALLYSVLQTSVLSAFAADEYVYVSVENLSTFVSASTPAWTGDLFDGEAHNGFTAAGTDGGVIAVPLTSGLTVYGATIKAFSTAGLTSGSPGPGAYTAEGGYISSINGLTGGDDQGGLGWSGWTFAIFGEDGTGVIPGVGMDASYLKANDTVRLLFCNGNYETGGSYSLTYGSGNSIFSPDGFGFSQGSVSVRTYEFGGSTYVSGYTLTVLEGTADTTLTALPDVAAGDAVAVYDGGGLLVGAGTADAGGKLDIGITGLADGNTYQLVLGSYEATYGFSVRMVSPEVALSDTITGYYQGADGLDGDLTNSSWQTVCAAYAAETADGSYAGGAALPYFLPEGPEGADSALTFFALVTGDLTNAALHAKALVQEGGLVNPGYAYGLALNMMAIEAYNRAAGTDAVISYNKQAALSALIGMQDDCDSETSADIGFCSNYSGAVTVDFDTSAMVLTALSLYSDADLAGASDASLSLKNWTKEKYAAASLADFYSVSSTAACLLIAITATGENAADWRNPSLGSPLELMLSRYIEGGGGFYYTDPAVIESYGTDQATLALADYLGGNSFYTELTLNPMRQLGTALVYIVGDGGLDAGTRTVLSEGLTLTDVMTAAGVPSGYTCYEVGEESVTRRAPSYEGMTADTVLLAVPDGVTDLLYFIGDAGSTPGAVSAAVAFGAGKTLTLVDFNLPTEDNIAANTTDTAVAVPLAGCKVTSTGGTLSNFGATDEEGQITVTPVGGETTVTPYVSYDDYYAGIQVYADADGDGDRDAADAAAARALSIDVVMAGGSVQSRTVSVRIEGPEENLLYYPAFTVRGDGATVLTAADALCQAMDEKGVTYSYTGGYLNSITLDGVPHSYNIDGKGSYWSFVFNDAYANYGMSDTILHDGDSIIVYWTNSWSTSVASLEDTTWDLSGDKVRVTAQDAQGATIAGATVTLSTWSDFSSGCRAITDANGQAIFETLMSSAAIAAGKHYVRIEKAADGVPQIVRLTPGASVTFTSSGTDHDSGGGDEQEKAIVHVRVVSPYGSAMFSGTVGWFSGMTAFDALRSTGLSVKTTGDELGVYVRKIGEYGEMDLGANSGWVYAVASEGYGAMTEEDYPDISSGSYPVENGDYVLWRFTEDWTKDTELNVPANASEEDAVLLTPAAALKNGSAQATLTALELSDAVTKAKEKHSTSIVVAPVIQGDAASVSVTLPRAPLVALSGVAGLSLTIDTPLGAVTLPGNAVAAALSMGDGTTLTVCIEKVQPDALTDDQRGLLKAKTAYKVVILCGKESLSDLISIPISIVLPYTLHENETSDRVRITRLTACNLLVEVPCICDSGNVTFSTPFPAIYSVGYEVSNKSAYEDAADTSWYYRAVRFVSENGLMNGTSQTAFSPDTPMTRGMLVTVLYRLEGEPKVTAENGYADLADAAWYAPAVLWATKTGIATGFGDGFFYAEEPLTREQMAAILYRYADYKSLTPEDISDLSAFTDAASIAPWAADAMRWAVVSGLMNGVTPKTLAPAMTATRAQTAAILLRYAQSFIK